MALGMTDEEILERAIQFARSPVYKRMRRAYLVARREMQTLRATELYFRQSSLAFLSETRMCCIPLEMYDEYINFFIGPDRDVSSLPVPFAACATDLVEGRTVTLRHGSLHAMLAASCAVPGLFPPQESAGRLLVDGAVANEVPVASAMLLGLRAPVVALYLQRPTQRVEAYKSSIEVATRATAIAHAELVREQLARAPLVVAMPVQEIGWLSFADARGAAEIGAEAAKHSIDNLLRELEARAAGT
jgi:predicted acylesterase/phospholipase RssA